MKKLLLSFAMLFMSLPSFAQYTGPGGQESILPAPITIEAILNNPVDDQRVTLRGKLIRQVQQKGDRYILSDNHKKEIQVKIKPKYFLGHPSISEHTLIEIKGEVDTHYNKPTEIDVDNLRVISSQ